MLKDAQKQAGQAGQTIANKTLLLFAKTVMLTTERFPRTNDDWEDCAESEKTWWKEAYKKAHAKSRIKAQANEGTVKFGAANSAAQLETIQNVEKNQGIDNGGMKSLEGYFVSLAATGVNKKSVLEQLVANNTKLAATNENLVMVKNLTNDIKNLERETSHLKKGGQSKRYPTLCRHFKKGGYHAPEAFYELVKNKYKRPPGWRSLL